jgi:hypothetical protein
VHARPDHRRPRVAAPLGMIAAGAALRTGVLFGLLGALYSGVTASFYSNELFESITHFSAWPHRDTFGALCFAGSALCLLLLRILDIPLFGVEVPAPRGAWGRVASGLLSITFFWGLFGWAYIAANSLTHPWTLPRQLSHFAQWPREGTFGLACFLVSFASAIAIQFWGAYRNL